MSHDTLLHRAVRPVVRPLAKMGVQPNHLTALRFATALAAAVAFAFGGDALINLGAALFGFSALLDRADGELARQTRRFSRLGHYLDLAADWSAGTLAFIGLGIGLSAGPLGLWAIALGALASAGVTAMFWIVNADKGPNSGERRSPAWFDPDDGMFAVPALLWCLGAEPVLWAAGVVAPAAAAGLALVRARTAAARRRPARETAERV